MALLMQAREQGLPGTAPTLHALTNMEIQVYTRTQ
jgi:hypothetical protein